MALFFSFLLKAFQDAEHEDRRKKHAMIMATKTTHLFSHRVHLWHKTNRKIRRIFLVKLKKGDEMQGKAKRTQRWWVVKPVFFFKRETGETTEISMEAMC